MTAAAQMRRTPASLAAGGALAKGYTSMVNSIGNGLQMENVWLGR